EAAQAEGPNTTGTAAEGDTLSVLPNSAPLDMFPQIPISSANEDLQQVFSHKRRIFALKKKDIANPNIMHRWIKHFQSCKQDCLSINAYSKSSVNQQEA
ncbi:uncharacterized protein A4U43_C07F900, partial [Asparagus officinalis]